MRRLPQVLRDKGSWYWITVAGELSSEFAAKYLTCGRAGF